MSLERTMAELSRGNAHRLPCKAIVHDPVNGRHYLVFADGSVLQTGAALADDVALNFCEALDCIERGDIKCQALLDILLVFGGPGEWTDGGVGSNGGSR
jgi:hypothetical protein